jgi:hypothetical protein
MLNSIAFFIVLYFVCGNKYFVFCLVGLYPEGQEVLYSYSTVITTGTKAPAPYVSQFNMTGMIKVQGFKDKARVQVMFHAQYLSMFVIYICVYVYLVNTW